MVERLLLTALKEQDVAETAVTSGNRAAYLAKASRDLSLSLDAASWTWGFEALLPAAAESLVAPGSNGGPVELVSSVNGTAFRVLAETAPLGIFRADAANALSRSVINHTGIVEAQTLQAGPSGQILLLATILGITNGVHVPTWQDPRVARAAGDDAALDEVRRAAKAAAAAIAILMNAWMK